jgi:hypothetical protein
MAAIRDTEAHDALQADLAEHGWKKKQEHDAFFA